ncbi:MAG: argininosuccinate lyase, partial [Candidatus Omnitrophica bacterium]|nr:argininosuccinate lyase [Candidatus Omnitrophota bacterium]
MAKKLWGGRFSKKTDPAVEKFTKSIHYDYKLAPYDIIGSLIQATVLKDSGYLNAGEAGKLSAALESIGKS